MARLVLQSISRRSFVAAFGCAAISLFRDAQVYCDHESQVDLVVKSMFVKTCEQLRALLARGDGASPDAWADYLRETHGLLKGVLSRHALADVVRSHCQYAKSKDRVDFLAFFLTSLPYSLQISIPSLHGGTSQQDVSEIKVENSYSEAITREIVSDRDLLRRYTHLAFWSGALNEVNFDSIVDSLAGQLMEGDKRYWWRARNLVLLLSATGKHDLITPTTQLDKLRPVFLDWIQWMKESASQLFFDADELQWKVNTVAMPRWEWPSQGRIAKSTSPLAPARDWMGKCNLDPRVLSEIY